jgi:hypothetical protein
MTSPDTPKAVENHILSISGACRFAVVGIDALIVFGHSAETLAGSVISNDHDRGLRINSREKLRGSIKAGK